MFTFKDTNYIQGKSYMGTGQSELQGLGSTKTLNPVGQRQQKAGNTEERYI